MAHNDPMTWRSKEQRWTKWYKGKIYNVSPKKLIKEGLLEKGTPATKDATRTAMRQWWENTQARLEAAERQEDEIQRKERVQLSGVGIKVDYGEDGKVSRKNQINLRIKRHVTKEDDVLTEPKDDVQETIGKLISEGNRRLEKIHAMTPVEQTIRSSVDDFMAFKRSQAEAGERSVERVESLRGHLEKFLQWIQPDSPAASVDEQTVDTYYQHLLAQCQSGKYSRYYARDLFASFRQFARWLASRRRIAMPHNLNSRELGFKLRGTIKIFTDDEVKVLLEAASERTKLYMLLMLNTGGTQIDIAELSKTAIDLRQGELTRKRFKTEAHENVPTVAYPLWPETMRLLKVHLNTDDSLVNRHGEPLALVSENQKPLITRHYGPKGQLIKTDAIRSAFDRVIRKLKNDEIVIKGSLKTFRKTASSKLEEHSIYGRYVVHFLGQSPETIAGRHYVTPSQEQFSAAVRWLGSTAFPEISGQL